MGNLLGSYAISRLKLPNYQITQLPNPDKGNSMKYYIQRGINEYGPYTLAELQRYVAQGNIVLTDLCRSEAMTEWTPVSQVIGNIPTAAPTPAPPTAGTVYGGAPAAATSPAYVTTGSSFAAGPVPPDFHWALVLLITFFCSIFRIIWQFVEAGFAKKIRPDSNFLTFLILGKCLQVGSIIVLYGSIIASAATRDQPPAGLLFLGFLCGIAGFVILYVGIFKMRQAIEEYYNTVEPINLRLSRAMTFFFPTFYFQHHFSRIAKWKATGYLEPQS
jgi:GYF domain 2